MNLFLLLLFIFYQSPPLASLFLPGRPLAVADGGGHGPGAVLLCLLLINDAGPHGGAQHSGWRPLCLVGS